MLALTISCTKDMPADPAVTALTVLGTYKITQLTANDGSLYDYSQLAKNEKNSCFTDLTLTFMVNGTVTTSNVPACTKAILFPDLTKTYANATWLLAGSTLTLSYQDVVVTPITVNEK